jgi:hypothetical protein
LPEVAPQPERKPMDLIADIANLVERAGEAERKLEFWHRLFEYSPNMVFMVKNNIVVMQNEASRNCSGDVLNRSVDEKCFACNCNSKDIAACTIRKAIDLRQTVTVRKVIKGNDCLISVIPIYTGGNVTCLVTMAKIANYFQEEEL